MDQMEEDRDNELFNNLQNNQIDPQHEEDEFVIDPKYFKTDFQDVLDLECYASQEAPSSSEYNVAFGTELTQQQQETALSRFKLDITTKTNVEIQKIKKNVLDSFLKTYYVVTHTEPRMFIEKWKLLLHYISFTKHVPWLRIGTEVTGMIRTHFLTVEGVKLSGNGSREKFIGIGYVPERKEKPKTELRKHIQYARAWMYSLGPVQQEDITYLIEHYTRQKEGPTAYRKELEDKKKAALDKSNSNSHSNSGTTVGNSPPTVGNSPPIVPIDTELEVNTLIRHVSVCFQALKKDNDEKFQILGSSIQNIVNHNTETVTANRINHQACNAIIANLEAQNQALVETIKAKDAEILSYIIDHGSLERNLEYSQQLSKQYFDLLQQLDPEGKHQNNIAITNPPVGTLNPNQIQTNHN